MTRRLSDCVLLASLVLLGLAGLDYILSAPSVTVDEPNREFPQAAVGETMSIRFPVHNRTRRTVRVIGLDLPGC
jgi:hypothetical protein